MSLITKILKREVEYTETVDQICDMCGDSAKSSGWGEYVDYYDTCETTIERGHGENYPEGGHKTVTSCDLCPECFNDRLVPWLESQGVKMSTREISW